jgi:hypothetical protein
VLSVGALAINIDASHTSSSTGGIGSGATLNDTGADNGRQRRAAERTLGGDIVLLEAAGLRNHQQLISSAHRTLIVYSPSMQAESRRWFG